VKKNINQCAGFVIISVKLFSLSYKMSTCNFAGATSGPYENLPYNVPKPKSMPYHPTGFIMKRTDYDYSQISHFCPPCAAFFTPENNGQSGYPQDQSYSCQKGGNCSFQQRPPGPGYDASSGNCNVNCPYAPYTPFHHEGI
jgi:hypothetical protein